jgi:hypothetical protein
MMRVVMPCERGKASDMTSYTQLFSKLQVNEIDKILIRIRSRQASETCLRVTC